MDTIDARVILDAGAAALHGNNPDNLVRRTSLASLLVAARAVKTVDAGIMAFRLWTSPEAKQHAPAFIFNIANERAARS